jgi:hypothetical protein
VPVVTMFIRLASFSKCVPAPRPCALYRRKETRSSGHTRKRMRNTLSRRRTEAHRASSEERDGVFPHTDDIGFHDDRRVHRSGDEDEGQDFVICQRKRRGLGSTSRTVLSPSRSCLIRTVSSRGSARTNTCDRSRRIDSLTRMKHTNNAMCAKRSCGRKLRRCGRRTYSSRFLSSVPLQQRRIL